MGALRLLSIGVRHPVKTLREAWFVYRNRRELTVLYQAMRACPDCGELPYGACDQHTWEREVFRQYGVLHPELQARVDAATHDPIARADGGERQ